MLRKHVTVTLQVFYCFLDKLPIGLAEYVTHEVIEIGIFDIWDDEGFKR